VIALQYHQSTKHDFNRFARSLGYLDWATQPDPFRRYAGARVVELPRPASVAGGDRAVPYGALYDGSATPSPLDHDHLGELLRCSFGLSAWKAVAGNRWALRVNPSSGNLHPTEAYLVADGQVAHYASKAHALEERAALSPHAWQAFAGGRRGVLVGLTSIHWREAWKYGERAFRYCQHDAGHAIGALRFAASMLGWRMALLERWSTADIGALLGVDRGHGDAEAEEPECLALITPDDPNEWCDADPSVLVTAAKATEWRGTPNRLSASHAEWPLIEEVATATRYPGVRYEVRRTKDEERSAGRSEGLRPSSSVLRTSEASARSVILRRRSAVAFDGRSTLSRDAFFAMFERLMPGAPPWDAIDWPPHVHLAVFVHRVDGLTPGLYAWLRDPAVRAEWQAAMRPEFLWENIPTSPLPPSPLAPCPLFLLLPFDMTWPANRVSCDQDIAGDGYFSLGMIARLEPALRERGQWFYRRLFWECGLIGQVLYLEAEAAGGRATGIGCYYDDPVHEMLGLTGDTWQSLYHFSMGTPVEDPRITSEPGYPWEAP
jgi:SagB-type dehydrogenase family enzyme